MTIKEISKKYKVTSNTVYKTLANGEETGKINIKREGRKIILNEETEKFLINELKRKGYKS